MSPHSLDPHTPRAYRRRARLSTSLGLAAVIVAGAGLIQPDAITNTSAAVALDSSLDLIWLIGYFLGGLLACAGAQWRPYPRPELEAAGAWLLAGAMLINACAIIAIRGPVAGGLTSVGLIALADVLIARARDLESARQSDRRVRLHPFPHHERRRRAS